MIVPDPGAILDPEREIVDCHHHLWDRPGSRYMVDEFLLDAQSGHRVRQSVFIQCRTGYRHGSADSPALETAQIAGVTRHCQQPTARVNVAAGIVGYADMTTGAKLAALLDDHMAAGEGRFKGVRHIVSWHAGSHFQVEGYPTTPGMLSSPAFGDALGNLGRRGLSFEAMVFHPQLEELGRTAAAHEGTRIVLNHIGIPLGIGEFAADRQAAFDVWRQRLRAIAVHPNLFIKLGGMGMHILGLPIDEMPGPLSSADVACAYRPFVNECVEAFGVDRCMFESNFPVDRRRCDYRVLWNAFKRIAADYSESERSALFAGTARRFYRLA